MTATASGSLRDEDPTVTPVPAESAEAAPANISQAAVIAGLQAQIAGMQAQLAGLPQQGAPLAVPQPLPVRNSDPDITGLPGVKPLRLTTPDKPLATTRHALFYIDDAAITIPDEVPQNIAAEYLHIVATTPDPQLAEIRGQDYLLTAVLGEDGYRQLREYPHLQAEQYAWVVKTCQKLTVGALETQVPKA